jgi:lipoyl synthase
MVVSPPLKNKKKIEIPAPNWLRYRGRTFSKLLSVVDASVQSSGIATVCEEASCPNKTECWSLGTATFMLMGDTCTRGCHFCAVKTSDSPAPLNPNEPENLAKALHDWKNSELNYIVLTSVDRDDLPDGGSKHLADSIRKVKSHHPDLMIEILIPDFQGDKSAIDNIINSNPEVISHNIETVERLQLKVRDKKANYKQSLQVLKYIKDTNPKIYTKSSIMVGLSEKFEEVVDAMRDLREIDVDFITIGQYMRPTLRHLSVREYIEPEVFDKYKQIGEELGFKYVASGPLVRSSYKAGEYFIRNIIYDNLGK